MNAGRELDALVAEKVMGLCVRDYRTTAKQPYFSWCGDYVGISYADNDEPYIFLGDERAGCPHVHRIPCYSTSIADAWQVVEKMLTREKAHIDLSIEPDGVHCYYSCYEQEVDALGPSAPLAICLAALKAVGVEVES